MKCLKKELLNFFVLLKNEEFFKAHEITENIWKISKKTGYEYNLLYKGLTNGAVSCELKKCGNENYLRVFKTYSKYKKMFIKCFKKYELLKNIDNKICDYLFG